MICGMKSAVQITNLSYSMRKFLLRNLVFTLLFAIGLIVPSALSVQIGGAGDQNGDAPTSKIQMGVPPLDSVAKLFIQGNPVDQSGTISSTGTAVTGSGTSFQSVLKIGDSIMVAGESRRVQTITNNTSLTLTTGFTQDAANAAYKSATPVLVVTNDGKVGVGTDTPISSLEVNGRIQGNGGVVVGKSTASICGSAPDGTIFFNDTSNFLCFCNGGNALQAAAPLVACF